jgi:hypothetical protein
MTEININLTKYGKSVNKNRAGTIRKTSSLPYVVGLSAKRTAKNNLTQRCNQHVVSPDAKKQLCDGYNRQ